MKKILALVAILCVSISCLLAQSLKTIKGKVVDSTGNALVGASVVVTGLKGGTQTDNNGAFSIKVADDGKSRTLTISYVGFNPTTIAAKGDNLLVSLKKSNETAADEVVVIGYQTVKRKDVLASVASVGAKDLKDIPINSAAEALNGRLAGVTATTAEGSPDAEIRVRVRGGMSITGDNSPLYIIDGVQIENGLSSISPQDIQNIDVLKDAAATAIYGARGANGVIIITTKSGKQGGIKLSYNGFVGFKYLPKTLGVLTPYDYVFYQSERSRGSSTDSTNFLKSFGTTWDTLSVYKDVTPVDWQREVIGQLGITTTHNISASGGNKSTSYIFGYTFNNDKAIVVGSNYQRHIFNLKLDHKFTKQIKAGLSVRYNHQDVLGAGVSDEKGANYGRLRNAVKYKPFLNQDQAIDEIDPISEAENPGNSLYLNQPVQSVKQEYRKKSTDAINITGNLTYTISKNLTFRSTFGYDKNSLVDRKFYDSLSPTAKNDGGGKPVVGLDTSYKETVTNSNVLTYSLKGLKKKHDIDILIGEETYDLRLNNYTNYFTGFAKYTTKEDAFSNTTLGTSRSGFPTYIAARYTSLSFFGRLSYSYKNKYFATFNMRADAASKFYKDNRWGFFPAASFAWKVKNEKFLQNVRFINDLKLRVGYGTVGNNRIDDYLFLTTFRSGTYFYGINNQQVNAYTPVSLANQNLKWESTENRNIGLDITLLKSRIDLSIDVYDNSSKDLLLSVPIDPTYGYQTQLQNIGRTSNKGIDVQLNAVILKKKNNLSWTANFNISSNKNTVEALGVGQTAFSPLNSWASAATTPDYITKIGSPVGSMWGFITDGFYTVSDFDYNPASSIYTLKTGVANNTSVMGIAQPGSVKFKDLNGDGVVDITNDRTIIGNPTPKFSGGLNQQFTYKQWDISLFFNYSFGNEIYNANKIDFTNSVTNNSNLLAVMKDRWKVVAPTGETAQWVQTVGGVQSVKGIAPDQLAALNANANIWMPTKAYGAGVILHSWAIEDGSFVRLNNITVGYSLPIKTLAKMGISKLRIYATGNNLALFTNYTGFDPEVSVRRSALTPALDYSAYPKSRSFIFGVNVLF